MFRRSPGHSLSRFAFIGCAMVLVSARLVAQGSLGAVTITAVDNGILMNQVPAGSAAARASLQSGDVISTFKGVRIAGLQAFQALLQQAHAGDAVLLGVIRSGKQYQATITLGAPTVASDADALQRRVSERQRENDDLRRQIDAANKAKGVPAIAAAPPPARVATVPDAPRGADGTGLPPGIYRCRASSVGGYYVVLTIRILDAGNYAEVGDKTERPGQYRLDSQRGKVAWLSGPLKASGLGDNRPADYEDGGTVPGMVMTVYRGYTAVRCRLGE